MELSPTISPPTISPSLFSRRATLITQAGASLRQRQQSQPRQPPSTVQNWVFHTERQQAFDPRQPSGLLLLDRSEQLKLKGPGTTPSLLAAYIKIKAQESVVTCFQGGLEFYFVIAERGAVTGARARSLGTQETCSFYREVAAFATRQLAQTR
ncbi:MAG: hypothetical protein HC800_07920 [Phormidesmis sp. RL_2_1]|nr:hypothetical protein [Phormidesmis sp. RL_2_1]